MRWTDLFGRTLREAGPGGGPGAELAQRAALARLGADDCTLLPLGQRVVDRILVALRKALPAAEAIGLPPGAATDGWGALLASEVQSYRQLPTSLIADRWVRTDAEHPLGLAAPRWTRALQWLSASSGSTPAEEARDRWSQALEGWCQAAGLAVHRAERGEGDGWAVWHPDGLEAYLACPACAYAAARAAARFDRGQPDRTSPAPLEPVATPGADTIRALAEQLGLSTRQTLKALFLSTPDNELIAVILRGDLEVSPQKLERVLGQRGLVPADERLIRAAGAEPGFASPIGLKVRAQPNDAGLWVVGDLSIPAGANYVAGANRPDTHLTGVNYPRDFVVTSLADVAAARAGDPCPECHSPLEGRTGFWVARWDPLPGFSYTDEGGRAQQGEGRVGTALLIPLLAALLTQQDPQRAPSWPAEIAPLDAYVVVLTPWEGLSDWVAALERRGLAVLVDGRAVSAGVKFADADLVGARLRITVSKRSLADGGVEVLRPGESPLVVSPEQAAALL